MYIFQTFQSHELILHIKYYKDYQDDFNDSQYPVSFKCWESDASKTKKIERKMFMIVVKQTR